MKRIICGLTAAIIWLTSLGALAEDSLTFGRFGRVALYQPAGQPSAVVLFVSGDGGWNLGVIDMARSLAALDALVVGIDINFYLRRSASAGEDCTYSAADFEALSKFVQKKCGFPRYLQPLLVGYSSGATLVYALLAQAPANTFGGALSLGFCPDLTLAKPLCRSNGLDWRKDPKKTNRYLFPPFKHLENPWIVFQGAIDAVCDPAQTAQFLRQVPLGQLVNLPKVGHGFSVQKNWMPQFKRAFANLAAAEPEKTALKENGLDDLPLIEVPATGKTRAQMAVLLTGDGGWAGLDQAVSRELAAQGLAVVALNTLKYFWTARTPEGAAQDLSRILRYYLDHWKKDGALLIGYSLGADVLPFMAARLPAELLARVVSVNLLGPSPSTAFEFHLSDWAGGTSQNLRPVLPEVQKLAGKTLLCLYGKEETDSLCPSIHQAGLQAVTLEGAHHFGGDYATIAQQILKVLEKWTKRP